MESFSTVGLRETKRSKEITFSRMKAGPKMVGLVGGTKAEAFEHIQNSSKYEEAKSIEKELILNFGSECKGTIVV
jgi:hypothetical protein